VVSLTAPLPGSHPTELHHASSSSTGEPVSDAAIDGLAASGFIEIVSANLRFISQYFQSFTYWLGGISATTNWPAGPGRTCSLSTTTALRISTGRTRSSSGRAGRQGRALGVHGERHRLVRL